MLPAFFVQDAVFQVAPALNSAASLLPLTSYQALPPSLAAPSLDLCSYLPLTSHQALQRLAAALALRLLALSIKCHLHVRLPGCQERAKDTTAEALPWPLQY